MIPSFFSQKSYFTQFGFLLLFILGGLTIFSTLAVLLGKLLFESQLESREYFYITQTISTFGVFLLPALLFSFCSKRNYFGYNQSDKVAAPQLVGFVLVLSLLILPVISCLGYWNDQITFPSFLQSVENWMRALEETNNLLILRLTANSSIPILLLNIVFMGVIPAIFEEFLFRGTMQNLFSKWFANKHVAIIVTAFIFSAIHFQFFGFLPRFLLGIYLGYLFVWSKSLWLPIIAHLMHNANSIIFDYNAQRRGINLENIDPNTIQGFYPFVFFSAICVGIGIYYLWKKSKKLCE